MKKYLGILIFIVISFLLMNFAPIDPTDLDKWNRSNMHWYKDHGTGCEYLAGGGFLGKKFLIERKDSSGKHICSKASK